MNNYEYLQHLPLDLFHATLRGLMGTCEMQNPEKADAYLLNWLQAEIDEKLRKTELLNYCEGMDKVNQSLANQQEPKVCTVCGNKFDMWDEQEGFGLHYTIGYGSKYDLNKVNLDMCCSCFDKLMDYILPHCKINPLTEYNI